MPSLQLVNRARRPRPTASILLAPLPVRGERPAQRRAHPSKCSACLDGQRRRVPRRRTPIPAPRSRTLECQESSQLHRASRCQDGGAAHLEIEEYRARASLLEGLRAPPPRPSGRWARGICARLAAAGPSVWRMLRLLRSQAVQAPGGPRYSLEPRWPPFDWQRATSLPAVQPVEESAVHQ